jgi:hypothetical protein
MLDPNKTIVIFHYFCRWYFFLCMQFYHLTTQIFWENVRKQKTRSCSININRRAEDARDVRQKEERSSLILVTGRAEVTQYSG